MVLTFVLSENVVYFRTVSEAVKDRTSQGTSRFRLAGAVVPGLDQRDGAHGVDFELTDGKKTVNVVHHGDPPELFKNGAPVVCEGRWAASAPARTFDSDRILIKHGSDYKPPKVDTKKRRRRHAVERRHEGRRSGILGIALGVGASAVGVFLLALGLAPHERRADPQRSTVRLRGPRRRDPRRRSRWSGRCSATTSRSSTSPTTTRARTPLLFTITGLWAALEGSILLWVLILAGYLTVMALRFRPRLEDPMVAWALLVALVGRAASSSCSWRWRRTRSSSSTATIPLDGRGPNPLLQNHPLMAFHPPMLYLGYVGFTVPFAFAMAALITGRFGEGWLADTRRTTLVAWGFLTRRDHPRRVVELRGARLGWLLGLGPGRERVAAAVAHRAPRSSTR